MATNRLRVQLSIDEDLSGLTKTRSALDDFARAANQSLSKTNAAFEELSKTSDGAGKSIKQSTAIQSALNKELNAGTAATSQHTSALKQLQDRQRSLASESRTAQQIFKAARQELQAFLGGLFGGSSSGSIRTPPFASSALGGVFGPLSNSSQPNDASALGLPGGLGSVFGHGIGALSGRAVALAGFSLGALTVGSSNRVVSGLGGAASGALIGTSVLPGIGTAIGTAIGGLVGLFTGGSGKNKSHDAAIANDGFAQMRAILDDYYSFRRDYSSSINDAFKVWQQMEGKWVRKESATSQRPYFDQIVKSMQSTEDERNRRRQIQSILPIPEFAQGGYVGTSGTAGAGGQVLATLHAGEFVMTRQAVERVGASVLQGLNHGSVAGPTGASTQIAFEPASASTLATFLKSNPQALDEGLLVVLRRGGPASRALRG